MGKAVCKIDNQSASRVGRNFIKSSINAGHPCNLATFYVLGPCRLGVTVSVIRNRGRSISLAATRVYTGPRLLRTQSLLTQSRWAVFSPPDMLHGVTTKPPASESMQRRFSRIMLVTLRTNADILVVNELKRFHRCAYVQDEPTCCQRMEGQKWGCSKLDVILAGMPGREPKQMVSAACGQILRSPTPRTI